MRLNVDFSHLEEAVRRMGAAAVPVDLDIDVRRGIDPVDPIDINLKYGIELEDLSGIKSDPESGLLSYQGRQVVLYIQDQWKNTRDVLADGTKGRKVHVADCDTLKEMRHRGRYERYVATNDVSGDFYVTGQDEDGGRVEGKATLRVCKNCLRMLDYRNYTRNRNQVFQGVRVDRVLRHPTARTSPGCPTRRAGVFDGTYPPNWDLVSRRYKEGHALMCENCRVDLKEHPGLLHVHHISGVKTNDAWSNLKALCADCHGKQPGHEHMRMPIEDTNLIADLRRRQHLSW